MYPYEMDPDFPEVKDAMKKVAFEANKVRVGGGFGAISGSDTSWQDAVDKASDEMAKEIEKLTQRSLKKEVS